MRARSLVSALIASTLLCALGAPAQAAAPVPAVRPLYFEHLGLRDGLSHSTVEGILQDSRGYLWLATESGLDRYDGHSIRVYRRERGNPHALASDYVWTIAEDAHGDLWLATIGGGVERWRRDSDRFEQFRHDPARADSLASDAVRTLLIDADGRIWAGTLDRGLDLIDPRTGTARHFRHQDSDPHSLASDAVFALHQDHAGGIWIGTDGGLSHYQSESGTFINYGRSADGGGLSDPQVRVISEDHTGALWIGTLHGGLDRLEPGSGHVNVYRHDPANPRSLSHDRVTGRARGRRPAAVGRNRRRPRSVRPRARRLRALRQRRRQSAEPARQQRDGAVPGPRRGAVGRHPRRRRQSLESQQLAARSLPQRQLPRHAGHELRRRRRRHGCGSARWARA